MSPSRVARCSAIPVAAHQRPAADEVEGDAADSEREEANCDQPAADRAELGVERLVVEDQQIGELLAMDRHGLDEVVVVAVAYTVAFVSDELTTGLQGLVDQPELVAFTDQTLLARGNDVLLAVEERDLECPRPPADRVHHFVDLSDRSRPVRLFPPNRLESARVCALRREVGSLLGALKLSTHQPPTSCPDKHHHDRDRGQ